MSWIHFALCLFVVASCLPLPPSYAAEIVYNPGDQRDPMIPLVGPDGLRAGKQSFSGDLVVEGIILDEQEGSLVLINGEFYKQGDRVQDANIISIFKDRVILSQEDEEKTLWIREEIVSSGDLTV